MRWAAMLDAERMLIRVEAESESELARRIGELKIAHNAFVLWIMEV